MSLFNSLGVELCSCPVSDPSAHEAAEGTDSQQAAAGATEATFAVDSVLFAGGPVWALDWCPDPTTEDATAGPLQSIETLAVATHPRGARRNSINVAQQGPGVLQVRRTGDASSGAGIPAALETLQIPCSSPHPVDMGVTAQRPWRP
jgi:hypothetical protein